MQVSNHILFIYIFGYSQCLYSILFWPLFFRDLPFTVLLFGKLSLRFTLASGIAVGQGINVGPGKFGKENNRRALFYVLCSYLNNLYVLSNKT